MLQKNEGVLSQVLRFKKIIINFSFRSFAILLSKLLGLITLPIISRALGPESYGNFSLVQVVAQYTSLPMLLLGLRSYGIREIAAKRKEKSYASTIISLQFSISIIAVILSLIISYLLFNSNTLLLIAMLLGSFIVFSNALDLEFFFISQKNLVFPTLAKIIGQLMYVIGVVLFIKEPNDFVILVFIAALSPSIADIIQWVKYKKQVPNSNFRISYRDIPNVFKLTWKLGLVQNVEGLLPTIPLIFLPIIINTYALGIFSGAIKISSIITLFYITFFYAIAPYLVQLENMAKLSRVKYHLSIFTVILTFSLSLGVLLFFFGEQIITLILGKDFGESVYIFKLISLIIVPLTPIKMLLGNIFIYSGKEHYYLIGIIVNLIVLLISTPVSIYYFGVNGAVFALVLSLIISIVVLLVYYLKKIV